MGVKPTDCWQNTTGAASIAIAPSILSADFGRLAEELTAVEEAGADWIHVDVMDGCFVPNITIGPLVVKAVRKATRLPVDVHLMIEKPERYVDVFVDAGADVLTVHWEACTHLHRTLSQIRERGVSSGVSLNPHTPAEGLVHVRDIVDLVLVMTVNPGFGGQKFLPRMTDKIRTVRECLPEAVVEVDGGVCVETAKAVSAAGAHVLVAGSAVFGAADYRRAIRDIRSAATLGGPLA